ncbi:9308_t:CDS:2, partial [Funneliformis mosseae]
MQNSEWANSNYGLDGINILVRSNINKTTLDVQLLLRNVFRKQLADLIIGLLGVLRCRTALRWRADPS